MKDTVIAAAIRSGDREVEVELISTKLLRDRGEYQLSSDLEDCLEEIDLVGEYDMSQVLAGAIKTPHKVHKTLVVWVE